MKKRPPYWEPAILEKTRASAAALVERKKRDGAWAGSVVAHTEYQTRPLEWITTYLGVPEETIRWSLNPGYDGRDWDGDVDPIVQILEALSRWEDVGVEAATGVGKTFIAACIVYWFIACFEDSIVPTVAPKETQLLRQIWKEMGRLWPRFQRHFPKAELLNGVLRMKPASEDKEVWAAYAFVCGVGANEDSATKAQGIHAEHMLIITEETPGIHHAIMTALFNTRTDDHNLQLSLGNPDHEQDELHKFCLEDGVVHVRISALDHPNIVSAGKTHDGKPVIPGAIGQKRLEKRIIKHPPGTRLYMSRVRGISPPEAEDALIKREWCEAAALRWGDPALRVGKNALGVDVADSPKGDKASIAYWHGACLVEVESWNVKEDAREVGLKVYHIAMNADDPVEARHIGVDSVGVGASAVNELKRLGFKVRKISSGTKALPGIDEDAAGDKTEVTDDGEVVPAGKKVVEVELFNNLRSQVWWRMRNDLRMGRIALPNDPELFKDLCTPTYTTKNGVIIIESKEDIVKRLKRSPDKGDAAVYGNWVRDRRSQKRPASADELEAAGMVRSSRNRDVGLERRIQRLRKQQEVLYRRIERIGRVPKR